MSLPLRPDMEERLGSRERRETDRRRTAISAIASMTAEPRLLPRVDVASALAVASCGALPLLVRLPGRERIADWTSAIVSRAGGGVTAWPSSAGAKAIYTHTHQKAPSFRIRPTEPLEGRLVNQGRALIESFFAYLTAMS